MRNATAADVANMASVLNDAIMANQGTPLFGAVGLLEDAGMAAEDALVAAEDAAKIGEGFGKQGVLVENPGITVDWEKPIGHGAERMMEHGVTREMINEWVKNGKALEQAGGRKWLFITPGGASVVANDGTLVTVMPEVNYDPGMLNTVERLFGKK